MNPVNATHYLRNIASSPQTASDILSHPHYSQPRANSLRAIGRISHRLSDLVRCEQVLDFLYEKPLGPDAFKKMCAFLHANQFNLDQAMDIAKAIQTEDDTFSIKAEMDHESDPGMLRDGIAVIDALMKRDMVFTLWALPNTSVERLEAVDEMFRNFMKANDPRCPQVRGLIVIHTLGPEEEQLEAWGDLTRTLMSVDTFNSLECPADWAELWQLTPRVRSLSLSGAFPWNPSDRRRFTNALRRSSVDEVRIECPTILDKMQYEEQIVLANIFRDPHLPRISKYHVQVTYPFDHLAHPMSAVHSDPYLTLKLISTMEELTFESAMCLLGIEVADLRQAASSLSLRSLTFTVPTAVPPEYINYRPWLERGKELSEYVVARRANQLSLPYMLGTYFLQGAELPALGEACKEAWVGPETAAALGSVDRRFYNLAQLNKEKVFRDHAWKRVEQCLGETRSESDIHKRYQLVKASVGSYGFGLYPEDWNQIWQTLREDSSQLLERLLDVDTPPSGSKRSASDLTDDDNDTKRPRT